MAIAIKNTPVLEGKNSKRFNLILSTKKEFKISRTTITYIQDLTKAVLSKKK